MQLRSKRLAESTPTKRVKISKLEQTDAPTSSALKQDPSPPKSTAKPQERHSKTEQPKPKIKSHKLALTCVCVDSSGKYAFTSSKEGSIIKWDLETRQILNKVKSFSKRELDSNKPKLDKRHKRYINALAISSDDHFLASGGWDKTIHIWSAKDLTWIHSFSKHRQEVTALAFRHDSPTLYSGSADRSVMIWSLEDEENPCFVEALYGHESTISSLDSLRRERVISCGTLDQSIRIWKIVEEAQSVFMSKHQSVEVVKYIDDKTFVSGGEDGCVSIWTTMKRNPVFSLERAHKPNKSCAGQTSVYWITAIATFLLKSKASPIKRPKLDDQDEHEEDSSGDEEEEAVQRESEPESGGELALVATGSFNWEINLWKLVKKEGKYELKPYKTLECAGFVNDIKFVNDGRRLVAACGQEHKYGRWWKLKNGSKNCLRVFDLGQNKC